MGYLVITRKVGESVVIGGAVFVRLDALIQPEAGRPRGSAVFTVFRDGAASDPSLVSRYQTLDLSWAGVDEFKVVDVGTERCKIAIAAPLRVRIDRSEVHAARNS